jgi:hypothetical protein
MESRKKLFSLGILTYTLGILLFTIVSYAMFILLPKIKDWELFSFNFYGCLLFYGVAILPYLLFASLIKLDNIKPYMLIAVILLNVELISFLISGQSIIATILTSMKSSENYILIAYPLVLLMSYFISKRILKINF